MLFAHSRLGLGLEWRVFDFFLLGLFIAYLGTGESCAVAVNVAGCECVLI